MLLVKVARRTPKALMITPATTPTAPMSTTSPGVGLAKNTPANNRPEGDPDRRCADEEGAQGEPAGEPPDVGVEEP